MGREVEGPRGHRKHRGTAVPHSERGPSGSSSTRSRSIRGRRGVGGRRRRRRRHASEKGDSATATTTTSKQKVQEDNVALIVSGCANPTISDIVRGNYRLIATNHGKPVHKKDGKTKDGEDVMVYFWDDRDGSEMSGWWFGPSVGGDQVWAFHAPGPDQEMPPQSEWTIPHDGPIDPTFSITWTGRGGTLPEAPEALQAKEEVEDRHKISRSHRRAKRHGDPDHPRDRGRHRRRADKDRDRSRRRQRRRGHKKDKGKDKGKKRVKDKIKEKLEGKVKVKDQARGRGESDEDDEDEGDDEENDEEACSTSDSDSESEESETGPADGKTGRTRRTTAGRGGSPGEDATTTATTTTAEATATAAAAAAAAATKTAASLEPAAAPTPQTIEALAKTAKLMELVTRSADISKVKDALKEDILKRIGGAAKSHKEDASTWKALPARIESETERRKVQEASLVVLLALQRLAEATPETYNSLLENFDRVIKLQLPRSGPLREALEAEIRRVKKSTSEYVTQLRSQRASFRDWSQAQAARTPT